MSLADMDGKYNLFVKLLVAEGTVILFLVVPSKQMLDGFEQLTFTAWPVGLISLRSDRYRVYRE